MDCFLLTSAVLYASNRVAIWVASDNVIGSVPNKVIQISFFVAVISGFVVHYLYGAGGAIGWYLTAMLFSISFRVVRIALIAVGFTGLMPIA